jgi:hypothetical protein
LLVFLQTVLQDARFNHQDILCNVLDLVYELVEDGAEVHKRVGVVKDLTFRYVYNLCTGLVS